MASDSLFGGGTDLSQVVSVASLNLINRFLTDTVGGSVVSAAIGGSTVIVASGSDGEKQGALLPAGSSIAGNINDGVLSLDIQVPAGTGFVFEGKDNATPDSVGQFLESIVNAYLPAGVPEVSSMRDSVMSAVNDLVNNLKAMGVTNIVVRMIDFTSGNLPQSAGEFPSAAGELLFDATGSNGQEVFAINLNGLNKDTTLVLSGVENVMLAGSGSVRIAGNTGAFVTSDGANQNITGGGGNDTLVGGGGNDTLTGGAGDDVFGFLRPGHFTIGDFSQGDTIAFKVGGITNINELVPYLTRVTQTQDALKLEFGQNFSLTLVGVSPTDITADMIKFTF
jgi:Ca2+-binding RTX toxin-like protein